MHNITNAIRRIATHPITAILLIDVLLLTLIAAGAYIIAQTLLPGIGAQFIMPSTLFLLIFALYALITTITHHTDHSFIVTPPHTLLRTGILLIFGGLLGIAHYFYGWIAGGILAVACILCHYALMRIYDDVLLQ